MLRFQRMRCHFTLLAFLIAGRLLAAEFVSQASILTPGTLELQSDQYATSFSNSATGMPAVAAGIALPVVRTGGWIFSAQTSVGYRYKQGTYAIKGSEGIRPLEAVSLHWIPMSLAAKITYDFSGVPFVRPTLIVGAGAQWLRLSGDLPGYTRSYWTPFAFISPALTIIEGRSEEDWFGGFSFGTTLYQSFASAQRISGLSLDLSFNILL